MTDAHELQREKTMRTFLLTLFTASLALTAGTSAWAATDPLPPGVTDAVAPGENSVNMSPLGVLTGSYGVNYERLFGGAHGLLVEGTLSRAEDDTSSSLSYGGLVGYRWHWSGQQSSGFLGLNAGYARGSGDSKVTVDGEEKSFDVDVTTLSVVPNIGKRWAWDFGLNITFRAGVGWGSYDVSTQSKDPDAQDAVKLVDDLLTLIPVALDGELSVGWVF